MSQRCEKCNHQMEDISEDLSENIAGISIPVSGNGTSVPDVSSERVANTARGTRTIVVYRCPKCGHEKQDVIES